MKKILIVFLLFFSLNCFAETFIFKTTSFSMKHVYNGTWTEWTDWEKSDMYITMNLSTDVIKVFSPETQIYRITKHIRNYTDTSGGKQAEYSFIDQDGDVGSLRLRVETNGNMQIYIEFADIMWVYNVRKVDDD